MKFLQAFAVLLACCLAAPAAVRAAAPLRAALFPVEFDDTSPEPPQPAELARVKALGQQLHDLLAQSGRYTFVSIAPVAAQASGQVLHACNGCEAALAKRAGAQVSVLCWVQKVSNLILNINAVIRDADSGRMLAAGSVDIRGNTDLSWSRGLRYLVKYRLLAGHDTP